MARFAAAWRTAGAGSTTLPTASLYAIATNKLRVFEIGVFNTTTTAVSIALRRATTAGTGGAAAIAEINVDDSSATAVGLAIDTHTVGPTLTTGALRQAPLGAAIGSGIIWTFGERGLEVPGVANTGICIIPSTGTGQILDVWFEWAE